MASLLRCSLLTLGLLAIGSCGHGRNESHVEEGQVGAKCSVSVDDATLIVGAVDKGADYRLTQFSRRVDLVGQLRDRSGVEIAVGIIASNGDWFDGTNLAAAASLDGTSIFLFRNFPRPIEGKRVFRKDLGVDGGWYLVPKAELLPAEVISYHYAFIGYDSLFDRRVYSEEDIRRSGFDLDEKRLTSEMRVWMKGTEIPLREVPVQRVLPD